ADAAEVAARVKRYLDDVAARQAEAERVLWLCHATREGGEAVPAAGGTPPGRVGRKGWGFRPAAGGGRAPQVWRAPPPRGTAARQVLEVLRGLPVLAGVHNPAGLANLAESERQSWQAFWQEVEQLLRGPVPAP